jgi:hypothetical protein
MSSRKQPRRTMLTAIAFAVSAALFGPPNTTLQADDDEPNIVRVEEDWVVEIGVPDPNIDAPQIVNVISPRSDLANSYAVFELNHATLPEYAPGGMQLQTWNSDWLLSYRNFPSASCLMLDSEVITYTMSMSVNDGLLQFEVINGDSTTWGNFGGEGYLKANLTSSLSNLSGYSPLTSTKYSQIGFASHQVKKFALKEVRYYSAAGLVTTDTTERLVNSN